MVSRRFHALGSYNLSSVSFSRGGTQCYTYAEATGESWTTTASHTETSTGLASTVSSGTGSGSYIPRDGSFSRTSTGTETQTSIQSNSYSEWGYAIHAESRAGRFSNGSYAYGSVVYDSQNSSNATYTQSGTWAASSTGTVSHISSGILMSGVSSTYGQTTSRSHTFSVQGARVLTYADHRAGSQANNSHSFSNVVQSSYVSSAETSSYSGNDSRTGSGSSGVETYSGASVYSSATQEWRQGALANGSWNLSSFVSSKTSSGSQNSQKTGVSTATYGSPSRTSTSSFTYTDQSSHWATSYRAGVYSGDSFSFASFSQSQQVVSSNTFNESGNDGGMMGTTTFSRTDSATHTFTLSASGSGQQASYTATMSDVVSHSFSVTSTTGPSYSVSGTVSTSTTSSGNFSLVAGSVFMALGGYAIQAGGQGVGTINTLAYNGSGGGTVNLSSLGGESAVGTAGAKRPVDPDGNELGGSGGSASDEVATQAVEEDPFLTPEQMDKITKNLMEFASEKGIHDFLAGVLEGFAVDGAVGTIKDGIGILDALWKYNPTTWGLRVDLGGLAGGLADWWHGHGYNRGSNAGRAQAQMQVGKDAGELIGMAKKALTLAQGLTEAQLTLLREVYLYLAAAGEGKTHQLSPQAQAVMNAALKVLKVIGREVLMSVTAKNVGRLHGVILFEVVTGILTAGATTAALGVKLTGLARRLGMAQKTINKIMEALEQVTKVFRRASKGPDAPTRKPSAPDGPQRKPSVPDGGCFVAGTPILVLTTIDQANVTGEGTVDPERRDSAVWLAASLATAVGLVGWYGIDGASRRRVGRSNDRRRGNRRSSPETDEEVDPNEIDEANDGLENAESNGYSDGSRAPGSVPFASIPREQAVLGGEERSATSVINHATSSQRAISLEAHDAGVMRPSQQARRRTLGVCWLVTCLLVAGSILGSGLLSPPKPTFAERPATPSRGAHSTEKVIESLRVGGRVQTDQAELDTAGGTGVDPSTWRRLRLHAKSTWDDGTVNDIFVDTLQPPEWVATHGARVGAPVPLPLDMIEMGLPAELRATVVANEPCPALARGPGHVVLTTVNHLNRDVRQLVLRDGAGCRETIRPTGLHRFCREPDGAWAGASELGSGTAIRGRDGRLVVESNVFLPGTHRVYNMTVEGRHVYYVSKLGALTHNNLPCDKPEKPKPRFSELNPQQRLETSLNSKRLVPMSESLPLKIGDRRPAVFDSKTGTMYYSESMTQRHLEIVERKGLTLEDGRYVGGEIEALADGSLRFTPFSGTFPVAEVAAESGFLPSRIYDRIRGVTTGMSILE